MYAPEDPRVALMGDFGLVNAPIVAKSVKDGEFYGQVSAEKAATVDSDVFLTWSEAPGDMKTFTEHNLIGQIPAIKSGHAYADEDKHISLAVTNTTPLSIPYTIEHFIPSVAKQIDGPASFSSPVSTGSAHPHNPAPPSQTTGHPPPPAGSPGR